MLWAILTFVTLSATISLVGYYTSISRAPVGVEAYNKTQLLEPKVPYVSTVTHDLINGKT